jgi:hypothetical protein
LVQNTEYVIVAVGTNSDGVASEMANVTITTTDDFEPGLLETTPAASLEPVMTYSGTLTVVFDEPIIFDDSKDITYYGFHSGDELNEVNVAVEGNEVTITPVDSLKPSDIVFVSWEEGTFTDLAGNAYPAMETGLDDDDVPYGLYFGVEPYLYEPTSILPDSSNTVLPSEFDAITIEFEDPIWDVGDGEMKLAYNHPNGDVTIKMVTKDLLTIDGNTLEISLPLAVSPGQTVELIAEEGSVFVGLGNKGLKLLNPSAGMEIAWVIEHPFLQTWVGSYTVEAISYSNPGAWDEDWNVTIIPSADDLNTLLISGIGGSEKAIEAVFDDELMTVTISSGANIGDAYGYGNMGVYNGNSDVTYNEGEPIVGDITEDGGISIDLFGVVFLEDPDTGSVWDIFETTWTHQ